MITQFLRIIGTLPWIAVIFLAGLLGAAVTMLPQNNIQTVRENKKGEFTFGTFFDIPKNNII